MIAMTSFSYQPSSVVSGKGWPKLRTLRSAPRFQTKNKAIAPYVRGGADLHRVQVERDAYLAFQPVDSPLTDWYTREENK